MKLSIDNRDDLLTWAAQKIGTPNRWAPDTKAIGVFDDFGVLRAVSAYNMFYDGGCAAHIASDGSRTWANRGVLRAWFEYPFIQLQLNRMTAPIHADNVAAQILALKLGFGFEGRQREGVYGKDVILLGMMKHECRWIRGE